MENLGLRKIIEQLARISFLWDIFQLLVGTPNAKKKIIKRYIKKPGKILEIGCATGTIADVFQEFEYTGIDNDNNCIDRAKRKFIAPNYKFYCADILTDDLKLKQFDYVLISHTIHHLSDEYLKKIFVRCHDLLKDHGKLVVLDLVKPSQNDSFVKHFYYKIDRGRYIRSIDELNALFDNQELFDNFEIDIFETRKFCIRIIDQCVISAR